MEALVKRYDMPLYLQVATIIRGQITDGEIRPGDRLPSEPELCETFAVSRATIRQAFDELEKDGLIERMAGRGTFLLQRPAPLKPAGRTRLTLAEILKRLQASPQVQLKSGRALPPPVVGSALNLAHDEEAVFAIRVIKDGRKPWAAVKHYVKSGQADDLEVTTLAAGSLPQRLARSTRLPLSLGATWVEAGLAEPRFAMMLKVPLGSPILSVWWVDLLGGHPAVCSQMIVPGASFSVAIS